MYAEKVYAPGNHDLWDLALFVVVSLLLAGYALTFFRGIRSHHRKRVFLR